MSEEPLPEHDDYKDVTGYHEVVANGDISNKSIQELTAIITQIRANRRKKLSEAPKKKAAAIKIKNEEAKATLDDLGL